MKPKFFSFFLSSINILAFILILYFTSILYGKYALSNNNFKSAEKIFKFTKIKKGYFLSLLAEDKKELSTKVLNKTPLDHELEGIYLCCENEYQKAAEIFSKTGNKKYEAYSYFKSDDTVKAEEINQTINDSKLNGYFYTNKKDLINAADIFLKNNDNLGLFRIFLALKNFPTAIYYLLLNDNKSTNTISDLLKHKEIDFKSKTQSNNNKINDLNIWYSTLRGDQNIFDNADQYFENNRNFLAIIKFLKGDFQSFLLLQPTFLDEISKVQQICNLQEDFDSIAASKQLASNFENLKLYSIVPDNVIVSKFTKKYLTVFGLLLAIVVAFFSVSVFYLYRKYKINQNIQRQKDLEKMDALSIAKHERIAARRKRDKTELNISSFVTLNIQTEVLDLAFTKLGIRANPKKLTEQLEKTNIPNISYKIYTVSSSYGLSVKMLSTTANELKNICQDGIIILILKGDLIALLKNADDQNAYMQFSQKDSRKVPFSALKLSWEGNYISLNTI